MMEPKSKTYQEFRDYVINANEIDFHTDNTMTMYASLKVFEDHKKSIYLGSLNLGFYIKYDKQRLDECLKQILNQYFPNYSAYEIKLFFKEQ